MAQLYDILKPESKYWDRKNYSSLETYNAALQTSSTVYVGNISFYTQQNSIKELFSRTGNVKDIIMGIDNDGNPCGFCFVIYQSKIEAQLAVEYISKTRLGGRIIRVDMDPGFIEGRQKGRGTSGQQRRDDYRNKDDPERPRKKVATNYQSSGRGDSYRQREDNHRGGYRDRGQGYRGREQGQRERGDDYRGGERREYRQRQNRGNYGDDRGERRDYRQNRQQRQPRQQREPRQPRQNRQQKQQNENKQDEY